MTQNRAKPRQPKWPLLFMSIGLVAILFAAGRYVYLLNAASSACNELMGDYSAMQTRIKTLLKLEAKELTRINNELVLRGMFLSSDPIERDAAAVYFSCGGLEFVQACMDPGRIRLRDVHQVSPEGQVRVTSKLETLRS